MLSSKVQTSMQAPIDGINTFSKIFSGKLTAKVHLPVAKILNHFSSFANEYYEFISNATSQNIPDYQYNLTRAAERIQTEGMTITHVCEQYLVPEIRKEIKRANKRIQNYCDAFQGYRVEATPIAYFEKLYAITRFVFTPYPLVSIPMRDFGLAERTSALAHEIGHYFYWNSCGPLDFETVHENLEGVVGKALIQHGSDEATRNFLIPIWFDWLEETFADICGVLLEGSQYVDSAIQLARNETGLRSYHMLFNDGEHPAYYLRPLIAIETLAWLSEQSDVPQDVLKKEVEEFRKRWQKAQKEVYLEKAEAELADVYDLPDDHDPLEMFGILLDSVNTVARVILSGHEDQMSWIRPDLAQKESDPYDFVAQWANLGEIIDFAWLNGSPSKHDNAPSPLRSISDSEYNFASLIAMLNQEKPEGELTEEELIEALLEHSLRYETRDRPRRRNVSKDPTVCGGHQTWKINNRFSSRCVKKTRCVNANGIRLYRIVSGCP